MNTEPTAAQFGIWDERAQEWVPSSADEIAATVERQRADELDRKAAVAAEMVEYRNEGQIKEYADRLILVARTIRKRDPQPVIAVAEMLTPFFAVGWPTFPYLSRRRREPLREAAEWIAVARTAGFLLPADCRWLDALPPECQPSAYEDA